MSQDPVAEVPVVEPQRPKWNWVSCPNPFYLLSAACVLHSTGWNLGDTPGMPDWFVPAVIGGYIAVVAVIAAGIVRLWRVWDDARTILLTLFLLFAVLALSLDQFAIRQPQSGVVAMLACWAFAVAVIEGLLFGLRLRLPGLHRLSLHGQLALMFLYPLLLIPGTRASNNELTTALLLAYSVAIALPLVGLWPMIRRGRTTFDASPWPWPWYPWTIPTLLSLVLLGRAYSLCLTFDSVPTLIAAEAYQQLPSIFGGHFAAPMLFAAAVLILEAGLVSNRRRWQFVALLLPFAAIGLCLFAQPQNNAAETVLRRMAETGGSPCWLAVCVALVFYAVAWGRGVPLADRGLLASLVLLTVVRPEALHPGDLAAPPLAVWMGLLLIAAGQGAWQRRSWPLCEAAAYAVLAVWQSQWWHNWPFDPIPVLAQSVFVWLLLVGAMGDDPLARLLRELGAVCLMLWTFWAGVVSLAPIDRWWLMPVAIITMALVAAFVWWRRQSPEYRQLMLALSAMAYCCTYLQGTYALHRELHWAGLPAFAWGLALLHVGLAVSAIKGGALRTIDSTPPATT